MAAESIEVTDFSFFALRKVRVFPSGTFDASKSSTSRWIASSSTFGITVCGAPKGRFVAYKTSVLHSLVPSTTSFSQEVNDAPSKTAHFHDQTSEISILSSDCDGRFLAVVASSPNGCFVHIYDFRVFALDFKEAPFPVRSIRLSDNPRSSVTSFEWNPAIGGMFAAACMDNTLVVYQMDVNQPGNFSVIGKQKLNDCVSCISWSPKGKQLVTGHFSGKMSQFKPELALVRQVDTPTDIPQFGNVAVKCVALCWVSTTEWLIAYASLQQSKQVNFSLLTVKKDQPPKWIHMEDVTYGDFNSPFQLSVSMFPIHNWQIVLCTSTCSGEVVVIGKVPGTNAWKSWSLENRFDVPTALNRNPNCGIGIAMDHSHTNSVVPVVGGPLPAMPPAPLILVLTTDGTLISCWASTQNPELKPFNTACKHLSAGGQLFNGQAPSGYQPPAPEQATPAPAVPSVTTPTTSLFGTPKNTHSLLTSTSSVATIGKSATEKAQADSLRQNLGRAFTPVVSSPSGDKIVAEKAAAEKAAADKAAAEIAVAAKAEADRAVAERAVAARAAAQKAAAVKAEAEKRAVLEAERKKVLEEFNDLKQSIAGNLPQLDKVRKSVAECQNARDKLSELLDNYDSSLHTALKHAKELEFYKEELSSYLNETLENLQKEHVEVEQLRATLNHVKTLSKITSTHDELNFDDAQKMDRITRKMAEVEKNLLKAMKNSEFFDKNPTEKVDFEKLIGELNQISLSAGNDCEKKVIAAESKKISMRIASYYKKLNVFEDQFRRLEQSALDPSIQKKVEPSVSPLGKVEALGKEATKVAAPGSLILNSKLNGDVKQQREEIKLQRGNLRDFFAQNVEQPVEVHTSTLGEFALSSQEEAELLNQSKGSDAKNAQKSLTTEELERQLKDAATPKRKGITVGTQSPNFGGLSMLDSPSRDNIYSRRFSTMTFAPKGISTPIAAVKAKVPEPVPEYSFSVNSTTTTDSAPTQVPTTAAVKPEIAPAEVNATTSGTAPVAAVKAKVPEPVPEYSFSVNSTTTTDSAPTQVPTTAAVKPEAAPAEVKAATTSGTAPIAAVKAKVPEPVPEYSFSVNSTTTTDSAPTQVPTTAAVKPEIAPAEVNATTSGTAPVAAVKAKVPEPVPEYSFSVNSTTTTDSAPSQAPTTAAVKPETASAEVKPATTSDTSFFTPKPSVASVVPTTQTQTVTQSLSTFSFRSPSSPAGETSAFGKASFGGSASSFSGGSAFGKASFGGSKPAFGSATTGTAQGGFSSFGAGGGSGFAKFAQQGNTGFGAASSGGGSTFGGSSQPLFTPKASVASVVPATQTQTATQSPSTFSFRNPSSPAGETSVFGKASFGGSASSFSGGSAFGKASFGGSKPAFGSATTGTAQGGFSSFGAGGGSGFAKFAQQGNTGFGAAASAGGSTFGAAANAGGSTFGGGATSTFGGGNTGSIFGGGSTQSSFGGGQQSTFGGSGTSSFGSGGMTFGGSSQGSTSFSSWR
ncbi:hypothetical protein L596_019843 [Steinernema carpocapsae]|uniref:Nucleoporin Nup159/Nup146 N-terminal domain-containing protein n=1 Tax=Steinernema carpocapsae TaxID=34508 RepID=A0A4U5MSC6_STECR|nr:hypothetical protein L596_019843 [Steinernema carpocapsae]